MESVGSGLARPQTMVHPNLLLNQIPQNSMLSCFFEPRMFPQADTDHVLSFLRQQEG